jgi:hypothetical protein
MSLNGLPIVQSFHHLSEGDVYTGIYQNCIHGCAELTCIPFDRVSTYCLREAEAAAGIGALDLCARVAFLSFGALPCSHIAIREGIRASKSFSWKETAVHGGKAAVWGAASAIFTGLAVSFPYLVDDTSYFGTICRPVQPSNQ